MPERRFLDGTKSLAAGRLAQTWNRIFMTSIRIVTCIAASTEECFDLARDINFHVQSLEHTGERAIAGCTTGLIEFGESVTWEARHLGVRQQLTSQITTFDRPNHFRDEMTSGAFRSFVHDHWFETHDGETTMVDEIVFHSPLGPFGWLVDKLFMTGYLKRLIVERCQAIKEEAESRSQSFE